jgi:vacuolar-type H+-ATPase subunit E/Vma4
MALADLLNALEAEATHELARRRADTREEATRIVAAAQREALAIGERSRCAGESELLREVERRRATARLAAAARLRDEREQCVRSLFDALRERVESIRSTPAYPAILLALVRESLAALPSGNLLRIDRRDRRLVDEALRELETNVRVESTLHTAGGVELSDGEGRTVRNTLEERLRNAEPELRRHFGDLLDEEEPQAVASLEVRQ